MRTLERNKQKMKYAKPDRTIEIKKIFTGTDGYVQEIPTGEKMKVFGEPVGFKACINNKLREVDVQSYGIDDSTNFSQMVTKKDLLPLKEGDVIWRTSEVVYKVVGTEKVVDETSADYIVKGIANEGLNVDMFLLQRNR